MTVRYASKIFVKDSSLDTTTSVYKPTSISPALIGFCLLKRSISAEESYPLWMTQEGLGQWWNEYTLSIISTRTVPFLNDLLSTFRSHLSSVCSKHYTVDFKGFLTRNAWNRLGLISFECPLLFQSHNLCSQCLELATVLVLFGTVLSYQFKDKMFCRHESCCCFFTLNFCVGVCSLYILCLILNLGVWLALTIDIDQVSATRGSCASCASFIAMLRLCVAWENKSSNWSACYSSHKHVSLLLCCLTVH